ncbi:MAG: hypothetical protein PHN49_04135 [Candidatus Omnitrophica bacterium]|nr:hypothetical protein [Candidatus Omnitrophota bacterium]
MKKSIILLMLSGCVVLSLAFNWPFNKNPQKKAAPSRQDQSSSSSMVETSANVSQPIEEAVPEAKNPKNDMQTKAVAVPSDRSSSSNAENEKGVAAHTESDKKALGRNSEGGGKTPQNVTLSRIANLQRIQTKALKTTTTPAMIRQKSVTPSLTVDPEVMKIQNQIGEIIRANEKVDVRQQEDVAELKRIADMTQIHKAILADLMKKKPQKKVEVIDAGEILRQEKIRLIREETEKNRAVLEKIAQRKEKSQGDVGNAMPPAKR